MANSELLLRKLPTTANEASIRREAPYQGEVEWGTLGKTLIAEAEALAETPDWTGCEQGRGIPIGARFNKQEMLP